MRETNPKRRIVVAVTGASGSLYARLLCGRLAASEAVGEIALIVTGNGRRVAAYEDRIDWMDDPRYTLYDDGDLFGAPASGSARYDAMAVVPCSMGMAGRIASGVSDSLASRAADVMLKERRRLVLVTREAPLGTVHLRNMTALSECGAVICPASPSFYSRPGTIEELCGTIVDRVAGLLGVEVPRYEWGTRLRRARNSANNAYLCFAGSLRPVRPMKDIRNIETDLDFENKIRPQQLEAFSGQDKIVDNLHVFIQAALMRGEALDHVLLHGPPGLGKTTLANIISREMGASLKMTSGPVLDKPGDLAGSADEPRQRRMCCSSTRSTGSARSWRSTCTRRWRTTRSTSCSTRVRAPGRSRSS